MPLTNLELQTLAITPGDPLFTVGGVYYLRVRSDWDVTEECQFMIVYHITPGTNQSILRSSAGELSLRWHHALSCVQEHRCCHRLL